jgi:RecA-family ATPase
MSANLAVALELASAGIAVFPARVFKAPSGKWQKRPLVNEWQERATTDHEQIRCWWRGHPGAVPGIWCGHPDLDLVVIDTDRHDGGADGVEAFAQLVCDEIGELPPHPITQTAGGGYHHIFRQPDGTPIGNEEGSLPDGINIRGRGGWIVAPGAARSDGASWRALDNAPPLPQAFRDRAVPKLCDKLAAIVHTPKKKGNGAAPADTIDREEASAGHPTDIWQQQASVRERAFATAALTNLAAELASTAPGQRNRKLYACAFRLATMIARGWIDRMAVANALWASCRANGLTTDDGDDSVQKTLASGFKDGTACPHPDLEDRDQAEQSHTEKPNAEQPNADKPIPPLPWINMANWDNEPVPEQEWGVLDRIPLRQCVLFSGEGAAGKSTTQLHLSAAYTLARDWLGALPEPGPAIFVDAEDDQNVLHRRLAAILNHYQVTFAEAVENGLHLMSLAGQDAVLATATRSGRIEPTTLYKQLLDAAGDIRPKMISIASSANVYAGSEIDRSQVQQFVSLLTRLAIIANGSVVLISHPSLTGISTDTGLSGTTQWHNAVRARFYMKSVKPEAGEQTDSDLREIVFKKNQYGPISASIVLRYQNGLFLPVPGISSLDQAARQARAEEIFLDLLRSFTTQNRYVSDKKSPSYAPAVFTKEDAAKKAGINSNDLASAMRRLFATGKIWNEPCGRPSRPTYRIALKT